MLTKQSPNSKQIVLFTFAGRKKFLEVQMWYILYLLDHYPLMEYHLWNFSRNSADNDYLQTLPSTHERIIIHNQFYEGANENNKCVKRVGVVCNCIKCRVGKWTEPYKYYANSMQYKRTLFIKLDDDILFIDVYRFDSFISFASKHNKAITSALVYNNGFCALVNKQYRRLVTNNNLPILSINDKNILSKAKSYIKTFIRRIKYKRWWLLCTNVDFFRLSHDFFLENTKIALHTKNTHKKLPRTRFSINTIAFSWSVVRNISATIGDIASMNDEEIISHAFDINVFEGFITSHFHFSDQRSQIDEAEENEYIEKYRKARIHYLNLR